MPVERVALRVRTALKALLAILVAIALLCCARSEAPAEGAGAAPASSEEPRPLLLVGWDGADPDLLARLLSEGRLPVLDRLARNGGLGVLRSEDPMISPILWTTLATGVSPERHGVLGFFEAGPGGERRYITSRSRRVPAFWDVATGEGVTVGVVSWYATWPAEPVKGFLVSDRLAPGQMESHAEAEAGALGRSAPPAAGLVHPPEESAAVDAVRGRVSRPEPAELARLFFDLSEAQRDGRAPVEVETERLDRLADAVYSARLVTETALELAGRHRPRILAVYYDGPDVAGHLFMDAAPPPPPGISEEESRLLGKVVDRYHTFQDELLGRLLEAVGPEANVMLVSDHGFRHGDDRPALGSRAGEGNAPAWHRLEGVILVSGPDALVGGRPEGATLYDVFPTLCALAGLPRAGDLEGRVLTEMLRTGVDRSPPGPARYAPRAVLPEAPDEGLAERDLVERLQALGYLGGGAKEGGAPAPRKGAGLGLDSLSAYNLGIVRLRRGELDAAAEAFGEARRLRPESGLGDYGLGLVALRRGDHREAMGHLREAENRRPTAAVAFALARSLTESGRFAEALRTVERAVDRDPGSAPIRLLAARLYVGTGEWGRAEGHLAPLAARDLSAAQRSEWHYLKGVAARQAGKPKEACASFERALEAWPGHGDAKRERCPGTPRPGDSS